MRHRLSVIIVILSATALLECSASEVHAQWIHQGPKGISTIQILDGKKGLFGKTTGVFRHKIFLTDGRVIEGEGQYVSYEHLFGANVRLNFSDGEAADATIRPSEGPIMRVRHHRETRVYGIDSR